VVGKETMHKHDKILERRAEKTANVPEQESSALFCVTVKAGAPTTMECKLCDATNTDICD